MDYDLIFINARRWFDNSFGNTYHSVRVWTVKGNDVRAFSLPFAYGYDDAYLQSAAELIGVDYMDFLDAMRGGSATIIVDVVDVARKRDL